MAKTPPKTTKPAKAKNTAATKNKTATQQPRQLKKPKYKSFHLSKRIKPDRKLPGAFRLFGRSVSLLVKNWKVFLGIVIIYGLLNALFVQGFKGAGDLGEIKETLDSLFQGNWGQLAGGITIFTMLLSSSGNTSSSAAGAYQLVLVLVVSLALIWTLRNVYASNRVRIRDGFYRGMGALVQFVLVLGVILLQIIPLALGFLLFNTVTTGEIATTFAEQFLWAVFVFLLSLISLYMISSSIFALYIVTLPDMTPMKALRSARQLVVNRRWMVMRKLLFLPLALLLLAGLMVVPVILFATPAAVWVFYAMTMLILPVTHGYLYTLYRSLV